MAKRQTSDPGADLVPAEQTDQQFIESVSASISGWFRSLPDFFKKADAIDKAAAAVLAEAKKAQPPKTAEQDEALQLRIKRCNQGKAVAEMHWDGTKEAPGITTLFHRLHRRATGRRDKSIKALDEAAGIYNRQHNDFVRAAQERAEAERRRLQAIADQEAEDRRRRELADLEAQALAAEEASEGLSEREATFVKIMAGGGSANRAATQAGYRDPVAAAARLMKAAKIIKSIEGLQEAQALREQRQAVAAQPLKRTVVEVEADVIKAAGTQARKNRKAIIKDPAAFMAACFDPKRQEPIPHDCLCIDESRLNQYARDLGAVINRWPGIEFSETDKVV